MGGDNLEIARPMGSLILNSPKTEKRQDWISRDYASWTPPSTQKKAFICQIRLRDSSIGG